MQALALLKDIETSLANCSDKQPLTAAMLAGLASLNMQAKLVNKALDLYQQSLSSVYDNSVFKLYINTLKQHKSSTEMNAAIIHYSTQAAVAH